VAIFARGANWIPADSFVGAVAPERYASLLEQARAANMNMLRVLPPARAGVVESAI
jgi:beta-mannosidase